MGNVNLSDNVTDRCRSLVQWGMLTFQTMLQIDVEALIQWGMLTFQTMLQIDVEVWYNGEC